MSTLNAEITEATRNDDGTWKVSVDVEDNSGAKSDFDFNVDDKKFQTLLRRGVVLELKAKPAQRKKV